MKTRHRRALWLLLGLAFLVRFAIWLSLGSEEGGYSSPDTASYLDPGNTLLEEGYFPSFRRTPVYPVFLASIGRLVSMEPAAMALAQVLLAVGTVFLVFVLAHKHFGFGVAVMASVLLAVDLTSAIYASLLLSETLFTFLLLLGLWGLLRLRDQPTIPLRLPLLVGACFSLLALCRPIGFLLFAVLSIWLFAVAGTARRKSFLTVAVFSLAALVPPLLWMSRNHRETGEFFLSTISAINLYDYRAAWNTAQLRGQSFEDLQREFNERAEARRSSLGWNEGELAKWKHAEGIRILMEHPMLTLRQGAEGLGKMYLGISGAGIDRLTTGSKEVRHSANFRSLLSDRFLDLLSSGHSVVNSGLKLWAVLYLVLVYSGGALALSAWLSRRMEPRVSQVLWLFAIVIAYLTFFSVGVEAYSRFRVPLAPILSITAAVGWIGLIRTRSAKGSAGGATSRLLAFPDPHA